MNDMVATTIIFGSNKTLEMLERIGVGAFGQVFLASDKVDGLQYAIKILTAESQSDKIKAKHEIRIHDIIRKREKTCQYLSHLVDYKHFDKHTCLIFNKLDVDLKVYLKEVLKQKPMKLSRIRCISQQIIDFGNTLRSEILKTKRSTKYQTPQYRAPEVFRGEYRDEQIDIWSLGIILIELSLGYCPFESNDVTHILQKQKLFENTNWTLKEFEYICSYDENDLINLPKISNSFKIEQLRTFTEFLRGLLRTERMLRLSAEETLNYPFLK